MIFVFIRSAHLFEFKIARNLHLYPEKIPVDMGFEMNALLHEK